MEEERIGRARRGGWRWWMTGGPSLSAAGMRGLRAGLRGHATGAAGPAQERSKETRRQQVEWADMWRERKARPDSA
ncbi:hypothetical protein E2562_016770 [Oryza meyeriana var. granulata]|uniref:Uncharacterized protein n=1 Tax=Oryza meyeriana var. granulata TaxID=110450 RepID=A0A6G1BLD0_9ORYZ|nr:hypothetical protein E2562_016770 [Oryza meyeriana var. granulata]